MKRSSGTFTLIALTCMVFFAMIAWQADAQRLLFSSNEELSEGRTHLPPALQARMIADRETDPGTYTDLSTVPRAFPEVGTIVYAYANGSTDRIVSFDASAPGTLLTDVPISGLTDTTVYGIDFRTSDGVLYGIATSGFPTPSRLVKINVNTGEITRVHPTNTIPTPVDSFYGFDFNSVDDRIRNVGHEDFNRRLNGDSGTLVANDTTLRYAAGDINFGVNPRVVHIANSTSLSTGVNTVYGVDITANTLVRIGSPNGNPSANGGEITTIGNLGVDPTNFGSMDIQPGATTAFASLYINSIPTFVSIDLTTGAASVIGRIGGDETEVVDGIAIQTGPIIVPTPVPTPTGTQTPQPTPTPTPGASPTATATPRTTPTPIPTPTPTPIPPNASIVRAVTVQSYPGQTLTVPFELQGRGGEKSVKFSFRFNPAVLTSPVVSLAPQAAGAGLVTDLSEVADGRIGINFDSPTPYPAGTCRFLTVTFNVSPYSSAGTYPLTYVNSPFPFEIRDGGGNLLAWWFEPGSVVNATTAAGVEISGRVLTPDGRGLRNAAVSLISPEGTRRVVTTSSFGYYRFEDVEAGSTCVVSAQSKRYSFSPRVLHVVDTLTDVDFIAN